MLTKAQSEQYRSDDYTICPDFLSFEQVETARAEPDRLCDGCTLTEHTLHATFGGEPRRHHHAIAFMAYPKTPRQLTHLQNLYAQYRFALNPAESYVNSDRPHMRRMVSLLV